MDLRAARAWHAVTSAVGAAALVLQLALVVRGHQHLGETEPSVQAAGRPDLDTRLIRFASYFTIWSNVLGTAIAGTLAVDPRRDGRMWRALRLDSVALLFATGVVHWFLLRPLLHLHGADYWADKLLHVVVPLLVVVGWLVFGPRGRIERADLGGFLVLPVAWLVYTLVRGAVVDWYPYPFIDVIVHGYARVAVVCVGVAVLILAVAAGCRLLDPHLPRLREAGRTLRSSPADG